MMSDPQSPGMHGGTAWEAADRPSGCDEVASCDSNCLDWGTNLQNLEADEVLQHGEDPEGLLDQNRGAKWCNLPQKPTGQCK